MSYTLIDRLGFEHALQLDADEYRKAGQFGKVEYLFNRGFANVGHYETTGTSGDWAVLVAKLILARPDGGMERGYAWNPNL